MLVGNDVVDLHDPWSQPEKIHHRFDSRAFTPAERARIRRSHTAHQLRWSLWAAKESAFKVARKLDGGVRFFPRDFAVIMFGDARAEVSHRVGRFGVWFERADEWLHAVALPTMHLGTGTEDPDRHGREDGGPERAPVGVSSRVDLVGEGGVDAHASVDRPSVRVREVAQMAVGSLMNLAPSEIEIVTDGGIPAPHRRDQRLPIDLSLSHHGRFVACAWSVHGSLTG